MKPIKSLFTAAFLLYTSFSYCQVPLTDTVPSSEKAETFKKSLSEYLMKNAVYPERALEQHTWGDVVLSCELDNEGRLSEPEIIMSPDLLLSTNSIVSLNNLQKRWNPEELDFIPFGRKYQFVFRYRIYMNVMPVDNKARAIKLFDDAKYEKALKAFDRAINDNEYDHDLFSLRAKCKEAIGDMNGAAQDYSKAKKLSNDIMSVIDVIAMGRTSTVRVSGSRTVAVPAEPGHVYP